MNIFLSIISILIYTTHCQQCSNTHTQSTLFSVSINQAVANVEGGISNYIDIIKSAADAILPSSSNIALATYGGVTGGASTTIKTSGFISGGYTDISSDIDAIASENFANNFGNVVSDALQTAISGSGLTWSGQQYHILFAASNPLKNGLGTSTSPEYFNRPCSDAVQAKQNNIQTYVVLIGTQGEDYVKEYFYCLVEDKTADIIEVDPSNPSVGIAALQLRVCKNDGIDVQITEVFPVAGYYHPYIEVLNRGRDAVISACFAGTCSNQQSTPTGKYFVGYGSGGSNSPGTAGTCGSACYQDGLGTTGASWVVRAQVDGATITTATVTKDSTFQAQTTDHSYALRAVGFNNKYGANWRMSCGDTRGTPGDPPEVICTESGSCIDSECNVDNAGELCDSGNDYCDCSEGLFSDGDTCITPATIDTGSCTGYVINDRGIDWTYLAWDMPYDGTVSHSTLYPQSASSTEVSISGEVNVVAVSDLKSTAKSDGSVDVNVTTTIDSPIGLDMNHVNKVMLTCPIGTLNPTNAPSKFPTKAPSVHPSVSPTKAPTFDDPGVYISSQGVCSNSRCECFEAVRACCTPFGPKYNITTLTDGVIPPRKCDNQFKSIEVTPAQQKTGLTEKIYVGKYGGTSETRIYFTMTALGQINKTNFEDLRKWTDYYDVVRRRRLATPSPTMLYGNKLNIDVRPPGGNMEYSGVVVIPSGSLQGVLSLNISTATLKCDQGAECTTYEECQETAMGYVLVVTNCSTDDPTLGDSCDPLYPTTLWISVTRNNALCGIVFGVGSTEDELPDWFWWVLIALIIFLLILAWLVYRFWWKQKKTASELGDAEDELDIQQADNEAGFGKDLDVGDVAFNPMATGVPGMNRPADAFGNELHQRQLQQQHEMVDVQAEMFQVRQDYGQVATGARHNQNQNQGY